MELEFRSGVDVELVKASAADSDVIFAARVSTQGERTREASVDTEKSIACLINYLMR